VLLKHEEDYIMGQGGNQSATLVQHVGAEGHLSVGEKTARTRTSPVLEVQGGVAANKVQRGKSASSGAGQGILAANGKNTLVSGGIRVRCQKPSSGKFQEEWRDPYKGSPRRWAEPPLQRRGYYRRRKRRARRGAKRKHQRKRTSAVIARAAFLKGEEKK